MIRLLFQSTYEKLKISYYIIQYEKFYIGAFPTLE